ncbi:MAG: aldehyde dehydrogenase family protein [Deltaproteobacteria bacterium]|nr:aldehyde dehydrogenase family protein [Deltaproteobacteria bacterium]
MLRTPESIATPCSVNALGRNLRWCPRPVFKITVCDLKESNPPDYALTGGLFSRSPAKIVRVRDAFAVVNVYINRGITGALVGRQPFGGFKMSGVGSKAGGPDYLLFLRTRSGGTIRVTPTWSAGDTTCGSRAGPTSHAYVVFPLISGSTLPPVPCLPAVKVRSRQAIPPSPLGASGNRPTPRRMISPGGESKNPSGRNTTRGNSRRQSLHSIWQCRRRPVSFHPKW